jgi:type IV pilus assembly protein PilC
VLVDLLRGALDAHLNKVWRHNVSAISSEEVTAISTRFSEMIDQGTSLVRCLLALAQEQKGERFRDAIDRIREEVEQGSTLSRAMAQHPDIFDPSYVSTVRRGEVDGELEVALQQLAGR